MQLQFSSSQLVFTHFKLVIYQGILFLSSLQCGGILFSLISLIFTFLLYSLFDCVDFKFNTVFVLCLLLKDNLLDVKNTTCDKCVPFRLIHFSHLEEFISIEWTTHMEITPVPFTSDTTLFQFLSYSICKQFSKIQARF